MAWLVFVDTNVLLDFYRMSGGAAAKKQLEFIDKNLVQIITGAQIEMEFLKNRQKVILETIGKIKNLDGEIMQMPPILIEAKPTRLIKKSVEAIVAQQKKIRTRIERVLHNPSRNDDVYKCLQRLFKSNHNLNLSRTHDERLKIRGLARKRWLLGYPPRKKDDTSIGDAVNWEWLVSCATVTNSDVIIVSRDGDYGANHGGKSYINDWLASEFRQRVGKKRKLVLTSKLTEAMTLLKVKVTDNVKKEEAKLLDFLSQNDANTKVVFERFRNQLNSVQFSNALNNLKLTPIDWNSGKETKGE